jgi:hypothetical protein
MKEKLCLKHTKKIQPLFELCADISKAEKFRRIFLCWQIISLSLVLAACNVFPISSTTRSNDPACQNLHPDIPAIM